MKKKTQKALTVLFAAFVLVVVFLIVTLNTLVHKNREKIRLEIQKSLGRDVAFENVQLDLWGGLGLSATNLSIADDPRFAATPLVQTKELRMRVRWLPLLLGTVEIKKFTLGEPEIQIIKNEAGKLNLFAFSRPPSPAPSAGERPSVRPSPSLTFPVASVKVRRGSIHYVDRSTAQPVELRLQNLELNLSAASLATAADIELSANFLNGNEQNLKLKGNIGPLGSVADWSQFPLNLKLAVQALPFLKLTGAVPFLKEAIPSYLDINGSLALETKVAGTLAEPHITGLTLTGAFFGSTTNNVKLTADLDFSPGLGEQNPFKSQFVVDPVSLDRLKQIPFVERNLPAALTSRGPLRLSGTIEGTLDEFQIDARINADECEIGYAHWINKPKGIPAQVALSAARQQDRISLADSTLSIHNAKLEFSGSMEEKPERLLRLRLHADQMDMAGWNKILTPAASYDVKGAVGLDLSVEKNFSPQRNDWNLQGEVNLRNLSLKAKEGKRALEGITSKVTFHGHEARAEDSTFRVGTSDFILRGYLNNLAEPTLHYRLSASRVNLADLTSAPEYQTDWIKELATEGELQFKNGAPAMVATFQLGEGQLQKLPYRNLRGQIHWRPDRLGVTDFSFKALGGTFTGRGDWAKENSQWSHFTLFPTISGMDLKALLPRLSPELADGFEGRINLEASLKGWGDDWATIQKTLHGEGKTEIRNGVLKDINLVRRVLSRVTGLPGVGNLIGSTLSPRYGGLFTARETRYDTLGASFQVEEGRILTRDVVLSAADYTVRARGSMGFDSTMSWDAALSLSPSLTRELMRSHRNIRYAADDQGRLKVPFRLAGPLPRMDPNPDVKALAALIREGLMHADKTQNPTEKKIKRDKGP